MTPLRAWISLKYPLSAALKPERVIESFCSNSTPSASPLALFSILRKRRRTLILSNADGDARAVLSPNKIGPAPGNDTTGLIAEV